MEDFSHHVNGNVLWVSITHTHTRADQGLREYVVYDGILAECTVSKAVWTGSVRVNLTVRCYAGPDQRLPWLEAWKVFKGTTFNHVSSVILQHISNACLYNGESGFYIPQKCGACSSPSHLSLKWHGNKGEALSSSKVFDIGIRSSGSGQGFKFNTIRFNEILLGVQNLAIDNE